MSEQIRQYRVVVVNVDGKRRRITPPKPGRAEDALALAIRARSAIWVDDAWAEARDVTPWERIDPIRLTTPDREDT